MGKQEKKKPIKKTVKQLGGKGKIAKGTNKIKRMKQVGLGERGYTTDKTGRRSDETLAAHRKRTNYKAPNPNSASRLKYKASQAKKKK